MLVCQASKILLMRIWFLMLRDHCNAAPCNVWEASHAEKNVLRKTWSGASRLGSKANLVEFDVVGSSVWESSRGAFSSSLSYGSGGLCWSSAVREKSSAEGRSASDSSMNMRSQSKKPVEEFCDGSICRGKRLH